MTSTAPRSPLRLRLYAWTTGALLGSLEGVLAVTAAGAAGATARPGSGPLAAAGEGLGGLGGAAAPGGGLAGAPGGGLPAGLGGGFPTGPGGGLSVGPPDVLGAVAGLAPALLVAVVLGAAIVVGVLCGPPLSRVLGRRAAGVGAGAVLVGGALLAAVLPGVANPAGAGPTSAVVASAGPVGVAAAGLIGPAVAGAGAGLLLLVAPQVCHELSLPGHRRLMPQAMALMPAGAALDVLGAWWLPDPARGAWAVVLAMGAVNLGVVLTLPESPVWLVQRAREVKAFEALRRLHGNLEAAVAVDWARHEAGMALEQQHLSAADLRVPQIRRATVTSVVLVVAQEAPLGAAALVLAPAVVGSLGGGAAAVAASCAGWCVMSVLALLLGRVEALERRRFLRVLLGAVVAVVSATVLVAVLASAGAGAERGVSAGVLAWSVAASLVALVGGQYVLVLPACQGAVDPRIPPWLVATQRRLVAVGQALARAGAVVVPLAVYRYQGLEVLGWGVFALTVATTAVVLACMPRGLAAG